MSSLSRFVGFKAVSMGVNMPEARIDRYLEFTHIKSLLASLGINCVLDVGANRGQFARDLRAIGYRGEIVSFEPVIREFRVLAESFASDSHWRGHQIALGAQDGIATIHVPEATVMSSFLESLDQRAGVESQQVQMRRLDSVLPDLIKSIESPRVFLKMDTQGYDLEVMRGAAGCLGVIVGIQSELSVIPLYEGMPHYIEALAEYEAHGFELSNLSVVNRVSSGDILELNCFMRRP